MVKKYVAEQQVDAEVKEEEDEVTAVAEAVVEVVVRNHVRIRFVRNQCQHDEIGRVIAEVEHVIGEPFVGNRAKHVNEDVLWEILQQVNNEYCVGKVLGEDVVVEASRKEVPRWISVGKATEKSVDEDLEKVLKVVLETIERCIETEKMMISEKCSVKLVTNGMVDINWKVVIEEDLGVEVEANKIEIGMEMVDQEVDFVLEVILLGNVM